MTDAFATMHETATAADKAQLAAERLRAREGRMRRYADKLASQADEAEALALAASRAFELAARRAIASTNPA